MCQVARATGNLNLAFGLVTRLSEAEQVRINPQLALVHRLNLGRESMVLFPVSVSDPDPGYSISLSFDLGMRKNRDPG